MTAYNLALFVHVVTALALGAANAILLAGLIEMRRAPTLQHLRLGLHLARRAGRLTPLVALLLLAPAMYLVASAWGWTTPWIDVALGAVLVPPTYGGDRPMNPIRVAATDRSTGGAERSGAVDHRSAPAERERAWWAHGAAPGRPPRDAVGAPGLCDRLRVLVSPARRNVCGPWGAPYGMLMPVGGTKLWAVAHPDLIHGSYDERREVRQ